MKYLVLPLILIGFFVITSTDLVYGMWIPQSPEELFDQSETVFVGTVTSVNVLEFDRSDTYHIEENGVSKIKIENYTQTLDEYTVEIEEFLKNSQKSNTITMLEATVGGVPGLSVSIGGFDLGDRALFYVPKIDGINQYSPESFKIPENCDAKSVVGLPRLDMGDSFQIFQDGIEKKDNLIANKTVELVYQKDMRTLTGKTFDFQITIRKNGDTSGFGQKILDEKIQSESKPCKWISSANVVFIPQEGQYEILANIVGDASPQTLTKVFSVQNNRSEKIPPPLKQVKSGIEPKNVICNYGLQLEIKNWKGNAICVKHTSVEKLTQRNYIYQGFGSSGEPIGN